MLQDREMFWWPWFQPSPVKVEHIWFLQVRLDIFWIRNWKELKKKKKRVRPSLFQTLSVGCFLDGYTFLVMGFIGSQTFKPFDLFPYKSYLIQLLINQPYPCKGGRQEGVVALSYCCSFFTGAKFSSIGDFSRCKMNLYNMGFVHVS